MKRLVKYPVVRRRSSVFQHTTSSECAPPPQPARGCAHERVNSTVPSATRVARSYWTRRAVATSCVILLFALNKGDALIAGARDDTKRGAAPSA